MASTAGSLAGKRKGGGKYYSNEPPGLWVYAIKNVNICRRLVIGCKYGGGPGRGGFPPPLFRYLLECGPVAPRNPRFCSTTEDSFSSQPYLPNVSICASSRGMRPVNTINYTPRRLMLASLSSASLPPKRILVLPSNFMPKHEDPVPIGTPSNVSKGKRRIENSRDGPSIFAPDVWAPRNPPRIPRSQTEMKVEDGWRELTKERTRPTKGEKFVRRPEDPRLGVHSPLAFSASEL
ncbi:hypothetical protein KM043_004321 [Ampulex compressa]|nr:hypothetical protein KM043_004321 [Ampulex compressa]